MDEEQKTDVQDETQLTELERLQFEVETQKAIAKRWKDKAEEAGVPEISKEEFDKLRQDFEELKLARLSQETTLPVSSGGSQPEPVETTAQLPSDIEEIFDRKGITPERREQLRKIRAAE